MEKNINIRVRNKNLDKQLFKKYEQFIYDTCKILCKALNENIVINIVLENRRKGFHGDRIGADASRQKKSFLIRLFSVNFESNDEDFIKQSIEETLHHEFVHVFDIIKTHKNPDCKFKPDTKIRNTREFILQLGFNFWTEFHAFNLTMHNFEQDFKVDSFYSVYKNYKELKLEFEGLYVQNRTKENIKKIDDYLNRAKEFIYLLSYYCAASHYKDFNIKQYRKKTQSDEKFIFIVKFVCDSLLICDKLYVGMFGKHQEERLFELGKLISKIRFELGII